MRSCTRFCLILVIIGSLLLGVGCEATETETSSLSVTVAGSGSVGSDPEGIDCGQDCQHDFTPGTQVTLTATPETGYVFESWGGACSGAASTCDIELTEDLAVTATFVQESDSPPVSSDFLGVPDPHGTVPAAIMPALPTADDQIAAFPYNPVEMPTPQWNDGANQYWVDANAACDDSNNDGRGAPSAPRCSLPGISGRTWSLAAGSQVFVVGNGASYGNGADINQMNFPGTPDERIWIIGVCDSSSPRWANQPKLTFGRFFTGGGQFTHVAMENIHFYSPTDDFRGNYTAEADGNPVQYLTFRHLTCSGSGTDMGDGTESSASRRCFNFIGAPTNPLRFVVIYDTDMFGLGRWVDDFDTDVDLIGMHVQRATYYVWFLNNRAFHFQGDSIHCSNSNQWNEQMDRRPHYIYVSGSEFYENYENSWDSKGCYHTVFSENYVHDYTNSVKGANNGALIAANDAESYVGGRYEWYLNNRFQDVGNAFAYKGTQQDAYAYFLGNLVSNLLTGPAISMEGRCKTHDGVTTCGDGMYVAQNTFDCNRQEPAVTATRSGTTSDPDVPASEQNQEMTFIGNLFFDCLDAPNADRVASPHGWETINDNHQLAYNYNVDFRDASLGPIALSAFNDEEIGNLTNVDPLLVDPTGTVSGDYTLDDGSQARQMVIDEPTAYTLFETMYGLSIRKDLKGNTWLEGDRLNAGAYQ
jgi:hypothetical protein